MTQIIIDINLKDELMNNTNCLTQNFTDREKIIIEFIGEGATNTQIAKQLLLNTETINEMTKKLLFKTNTRNPAHLMMYAAVNNILDNQ